MDLGLAGRAALVTGSYRGTGAGIARVLAREGVHVFVHGLEPGQADDVAAELRAEGGAATAVCGDVRDDADPGAAHAAAADAPPAAADAAARQRVARQRRRETRHRGVADR